ncbi:MAG: hypothetical protein GY710_02220 [Desulfobacteraceae bacterium]|nr:hypothetical protein [Desulfobacteraceae bacterium]
MARPLGGGPETRHANWGAGCEGGTPKLTVQAESTRTVHHWMQPAWIVVGNSFSFD